MKHLVKLFLLIGVCAVSASAQKNIQPKNLYVEIPREVSLPVIAVQPECPVKFEEVRRFAGVNGGGFNTYKLHNIGTKPITNITVASTNGSVYTWGEKSGVFIMPGKVIPEVKDDLVQIVPLTNELREKLNIKDSMKSVVIFMITSIKFSDGTNFDDEKTYKSLMPYYEKIQGILHP